VFVRTPPWLTVLDDTIAACITHHRADLAGRLERRRALLSDSKLRVPVIGELNQGKSQLVNALVTAEVCAVGDDVTTLSPTMVEHAETPTAALVADAPETGRRAIGAASGGTDRVAVPVEEVASRALVDPREDMHAEVGIPRELLAGGLMLIDTPGIGGTSAVRTARTFSVLAGADAVLMITDATCELGPSELDLLKQVVKVCPALTVVLTKIDIAPRWRRVAERNRARLAAAGLRVPVIPVSASIRLTAARTGDAALNEESGFVDLVARLRRDVVGRPDMLARAATMAVTGVVAEQLAAPLQAELTTAASNGDVEARARWHAAQQRLDQLRKRTTRWQTVLADEVTDLISDVEFDLRERTRRIIRTAEEYFDDADPARTWEPFEDWLRDRLTETAETNFDWLIDRFSWLAKKVARQVAIDESVPDGIADEGLLDHIGDLEPPRIEKFSVGQQLFVGLRGSYGGLLMFGLATTIAGMDLINPISLGAGVAFGAKSVFDERGSRLKRRQQLAKSTAQRHVDDFFLSYNKATRDTARMIQRRLRDHFTAVVEQMQASIAEQASAAKRDVEADIAARRRRSQEITREVERLAVLHKRIQALAREEPKGLTA